MYEQIKVDGTGDIMDIEVGILISVVGVLLSISGAIYTTKDRSKIEGQNIGTIQQTLTDIKEKVDEIWIDKKASEKTVANLQQEVAMQSRDLKTAFSKLDELEECMDTTMSDVSDLKTHVELLNARLCKDGKQYVE